MLHHPEDWVRVTNKQGKVKVMINHKEYDVKYVTPNTKSIACPSISINHVVPAYYTDVPLGKD